MNLSIPNTPNNNPKSKQITMPTKMAGQEGLEPTTTGFGDRCSTIGATDLKC